MITEAATIVNQNIIETKAEKMVAKPVTDEDILPIIPDLSRVIAHYFKSVDEREETLQGLLTHLLIKLPSYKYLSPLSHWSLKITTNYCISKLRRAKIIHFFSLDAIENNDVECEADKPLELLTKKEHINMVQKAIKTLPSKEREMILLCDIMSKNDKDVASILNISHSNLRVRKHRARATLKEKLIKMGYQHG